MKFPHCARPTIGRDCLYLGNSTLNVKFGDWMFLQEDGYLINIAKVKKFGITLGRVILFFEKNVEKNVGNK